MKRLLLLLLFIPSLSFSQSLDQWDVVREGYYKVVVGQDTLQDNFTRYDTALKKAYDSAENSAQGLEVEIIPPSYRFEYSYVDVDTTSETVYDTANVEDLTLRQVNMGYDRIDGERSLSYQAEAHGDSVLFEYFHNGQSLQKSLQYPNGGIVRDTLKDPPIDSIQVWVHGYWDKWVEPYHEIVDIAFLDTLGTSTDTSMSQYFTDFSDDTVGNTPSGFSLLWGSNTTLEVVDNGGTNEASLTVTSENRVMWRWDDVGVIGDGELFVQFRVNNQHVEQTRNYLRGGGSAGAEDALRLAIDEGASIFSASKYVNGSNESITSDNSHPQADDGEVWNIRTRIDGDRIRSRTWEDGTGEPSSYAIDTTDADFGTGGIETGYLGIGIFNAYDDLRILKVGAGTDGDAAPTEDTGGATALSGSIDSSFTLSGNTTEDATLSGDIINEASVSGNTIQQAALSGNIDTESSLTGNLIQQAVLSGELQAASELAGAVVKQMALSGQIDSESSLSGQLIKQALLSGSIDAQSALSGNIIIVDEGVTSLSGSISTESSLSGNLTATKQIQGIIESETDLSGDVVKQVALSGNVLTVSSISADASIQKALAGTLLVSSSISGELTPVGAAWGGTIDITNSPLYSISFEVKPMHKIDIQDDPLYTINIKVKDE